MAQLKTLISHEHKLIYVWTPKCASSTMFRVFQSIIGVPPALNSRRLDATDEILQGYNANRLQTRLKDVDALNSEYPDYFRFCITRNPYDRFVSGYNNKIDYLAEKLFPDIYADYTDTIRMARANSEDIPGIRKRLLKRISLDQAIDSVAEYGTRFDPHFQTQDKHLMPDHFRYDRILKQETLDQDLMDMLVRRDIPGDRLAQIAKFPRYNKTKRIWFRQPRVSVSQKQKIYEIYQQDFETFSYPR